MRFASIGRLASAKNREAWSPVPYCSVNDLPFGEIDQWTFETFILQASFTLVKGFPDITGDFSQWVFP